MLYILTIGICIGVALGLVVPVSIAAYLALLLVSALSLVFGRRSARALIVALACAAIVVGLARAEFFMQTVAHENVLQFAGKQAVIDGVVVNDPERRDTSLRLEINVATIDDAPARGVILAEVPRDGSISYGDRVRVRGAIMAPQAFDAEGGRQFDYPIYLRVHGIGAIMYRGSVLEDARGGFSVQGSLFAIKHAFESSLDRAFVEPDTSLIKGVLLGERHGLPADLESALVAAGLIHIVILAGYALSIVSRGVLRGLAFIMPKRPRLGVSALLLVAFVLMTGAASTTVRASIMALIAMLARALERPSIALHALAVAILAMVLWNPIAILYDESLIISAAAVFGLVTCGSWIGERLRAVPETFGLREIVASTISVQIFALPAILYYTGTLSVWSVPANLLALPALPWIMLGGLLAGVSGLLSPLAAAPFVLIVHVLLQWVITIAHMVTSLPLGAATINAFPGWIAIAAYVPLIWWGIVVYRRGVAMEI